MGDYKDTSVTAPNKDTLFETREFISTFDRRTSIIASFLVVRIVVRRPVN